MIRFIKINSITDVPDDQGGWITLTFNASGHDSEGSNINEQYNVEMMYEANWLYAGSGVAYGGESYGFLVHTIVDSSGKLSVGINT